MSERMHDPAPAPAPALRRLDSRATLSALARAAEGLAPTTSARDAEPAASQAPAEQAQGQAPAAGYRNHQAAERWMESAERLCNLEPDDLEHRAVLIENLAAYGSTILNRQISMHEVRRPDLGGKPGTKEHRNRWERAFKWLDNQRGSVEPTPSDHLPRFKAFGPGDGPAYAVTEAQAAQAHAAGWRVIGPGYGSSETSDVGPLRVDEEGRRWEILPDGTEIQVYTLNELGVMNGKQISDHLETIMSSFPTPGEIPKKQRKSAGYIPPWLLSSASGALSLVTAIAAEITRDGSEWGRF